MSFRWLALARAEAAALGAAGLTGGAPPLARAGLRDPTGRPAGELRAWEGDVDEPPGALRVDPRAIDPGGAPAWISLVLDPGGASLPFDDPAVSGALRRVLAGPPAGAVSTLLVAEVRFAGALTAVHSDAPEPPRRLLDDPFARVFPARLVRCGAGLVGRVPAPPGPGIARYGGGSPWPWDRF